MLDDLRSKIVKDVVMQIDAVTTSGPNYAEQLICLASDLVGSAVLCAPEEYRKEIAEIAQLKIISMCDKILSGKITQKDAVILNRDGTVEAH